MLNFFKKEPDMHIQHYELLSRIFGTEEAKKHLLNVTPPHIPTPDEVVRDAQAIGSTMGGHGWQVIERGIWFKLLGALRLSLAAKTIDEREAARNQVLAYLAILHMPYELKWSADNINKMKELEKSFKDANSSIAG